MGRKGNNRIFVIVTGIILVLLCIFIPVSADTNGTGDFTGQGGSAVKAWTNLGSSPGATQDESGYYLEIYCSDVLGEEGSEGADYIQNSESADFTQ